MSIPVTEVKGAMDRILADRDRPWKVTVAKDVDFGSSEAVAVPTPTHQGESSSNREVRVTSSSGGQKATKEWRPDLIPQGPLKELGVLYGRGQQKYPDEERGIGNWTRGYDWSLSYGAALRHINSFWMGDDYDPEMAVKHVISAAWHCLNLAWFMENRPEFDDRPVALGIGSYDGARQQ